MDRADAVAPRRPTWGFAFGHPGHAIALGLGSGLAPRAPGTAGTVFAWASYYAVAPLLAPAWQGAALLGAALALGCWAATATARALGSADPSSIVCDEVVAFWIVLWLVMPAGWIEQLAAFALFRFFDAAKPGPVAWADRLFKPAPGAAAKIGWRQGAGIMLDDLVAALATLLVIALARVALG